MRDLSETFVIFAGFMLMFGGALMVVIPICNLLNDRERIRRWRAPQHDSLLQCGLIIVGFCVLVCGLVFLERIYPR